MGRIVRVWEIPDVGGAGKTLDERPFLSLFAEGLDEALFGGVGAVALGHRHISSLVEKHEPHPARIARLATFLLPHRGNRSQMAIRPNALQHGILRRFENSHPSAFVTLINDAKQRH